MSVGLWGGDDANSRGAGGGGVDGESVGGGDEIIVHQPINC